MSQTRKNYLQSAVLIISISLLSAFSSLSVAQTTAPTGPEVPTPVFTSKDWRLDERVSSESAQGLCIASTTALYNNINHHLEVVIDRSGARPLEIRIRPDGDTDPLTLGLKATLDRKATQVYSFAPLAASLVAASLVAASPASADTQGRIFWNVPRGTVDLVSYLKRELRFDVESLLAAAPAPTPLPDGKPAPAPKPLAFSLRGSSATIAELQKRCNDRKELGADGFERAFLPAIVATVDPSKLSEAATARLRDLIATANSAYKMSGQTQSELGALTAKYLVQIKEFEQLKRNVDRLTNQEIVKLQQRRTNSQAAIASAQTALPQLRANVGAKESELAVANHDYEITYNILAPLLPQIGALQRAIDGASSSLSAAQSQLSTAINYQSQSERGLQEAINGIAISERNVVSLQNEFDGLRPELSRANTAVDYARRDLANAEARRRSYNRGSEVRDRLSRDYRYSQAENRERDVRNQMGSAQQAQSSADQTLRAAEQNKRLAEQSKRQAQQAKQSAEQNRSAAAARADQAAQDQGNCENRQSPENPIDCSAYGAALKQARSDMYQAEQAMSQADQANAQADQALAQADQGVRAAEPAARQAADRVRSLERDIETAQREMQSVRSTIERDVDNEVERLVREEQRMASGLRDAESVANRIDRRMRDIANIEVPAAQNEVTKWRASRSQAESDLRTAQSDVSRAEGYVRSAESDVAQAESRLSSYKNANGYRQKRADVDRTLERVNSLKTELRRLDREIVKCDTVIRDENSALLVIEQEMQKIVATIQQKEARSTEVQKLLEPYFLEHDRLTQLKVNADQTFASSQASFAAGLPQ